MASTLNKDLDLKNLHKLPIAAQIGLCILLVILIMLLGYVAIFQNQIDTLTNLQNQETELKASFTQKSTQATNLENLKLELKAINSSFETLLKQLPTDAEIPNLIQELHQAAATNGMRMDSVTPMPPSNDGPIQTLPYAIAISGSYDQISRFARDVGALSRIITLDTFTLKSNDQTKQLHFSATANTYKVRPAEEVEAERLDAEASAPDES